MLSVIVFAASFIPKGALSLNPKLINEIVLTGPTDPEDQRDDAEKDQGGDDAEKDQRGDDRSSEEKSEERVKSTNVGAVNG